MIMYCPVCNKEHDVPVIRRPAKFQYKGKTVEFEQTVYRCDNLGDDFNLIKMRATEENRTYCDGRLLDINIKALREAYERS